MHLQPVFQGHEFVSADADTDVGAEVFQRGLCLPSDVKITGKRNLNSRDMWLGVAVLLDHIQEDHMDIRLEEYDFYIRPNATDMRKGSTGLAYIVQNQMRLKPFDKAVFVFCGRSRRTIKAIVWDRNGWIEIIKRLECNQSFRWPNSTQEAAAISVKQLVGLLNGNDVWRSFPVIRPQLVG